MKENLKTLIMCKLSDAQYMMRMGKTEDANWLIDAAKEMLFDFDEKEVDFAELSQRVVKVIGPRK